MKYLYATIAFLIASTPSALAADYSVKFGPSIQDGETNGSAKGFGIRREEDVFYTLGWATELGGYVDNGGHGRKSAGLFKLQLGARPGPRTGVFGKAFAGPCVITQRDSQLGGEFPQFCTDIGIGVRDPFSFMSVTYGHISSAGLRFPNAGRDFLSFELGISL